MAPSVVSLLLSHGAEINVRDEESGSTPLHHAASWGRVEVTELLVAEGADLNVRTISGVTALERALQNNHSQIAAFLRAHGAKDSAPVIR